AANTRTRALTPATSIAGHWAPNRASTGAAFGAMAAFPLNAAAKAEQAKQLGNALCYVEPAPFGAILDELRTLVVDTVAFTPDLSGLGASVPSGPAKHTVERFALTPDKVRLRYEITVEDPMYLTGPATLSQQWEHRPDIEFSQDTDTCEAGARDKYKQAF